MSETLLDIDGAAERLAISPRFMRKLVAERRIPFLKVGRLVRFDVADLNRWLDGCRVEAVD
ncbi:MAG: helix-turn-helix domain-containing protein [Acidimicrobiales bacterium]